MWCSVFYILAFLSRNALGYEIEEYELETPEYILSYAEEEQDDLSPVLDFPEHDHEDLMELEELVDDGNSNEDIPPETGISFGGPVKAKGTVAVAATFGYDSSAAYPSTSSMGSFWFLSPQYFFPLSPRVATPNPSTLQSIFWPGLENSAFPENILEKFEVKPSSKEIYLKVTPLVNEDIDRDLGDPYVELLSRDEEVEPVVFLDQDLTDDLSADEISNDDLVGSSDHGAVFGGFVPASGSITIAGRF